MKSLNGKWQLVGLVALGSEYDDMTLIQTGRCKKVHKVLSVEHKRKFIKYDKGGGGDEHFETLRLKF